MSVKVATEEGHTAELLCIVRALLKKIRQTVLVGDNVKVVGIDWPAQRGDDCSLLEVLLVLQLLPRARARMSQMHLAGLLSMYCHCSPI